jgi:myo-inositol-1(or 4)-monophosphatase
MSLDNPNSIAYRLCLVASGARDGTVRVFSCHEWDVAAADIIVREAGGQMTGLDGDALVYNKPNPILRGYIAAGPGLYSELKRRVDQRGHT